MPNIRSLQKFSLTSLILAMMLFVGFTIGVSAEQEKSGGNENTSQRLPIHHPDGTKLTEQQLKGAFVFFQRYSHYHLAMTFGSGGSKYCCVASLGPNLSGLFRDATPDHEKALREIILNSGPTYMPSWKHDMTAKRIDDIKSCSTADCACAFSQCAPSEPRTYPQVGP